MVGPTPSVAEATVGQRFERYSLCVRLLTVEVLKVIEYESADAVAPSLVREFIERRRRADGSFALSEHKALRIEGSDDSRAIVGRDVGGTLVAYAQAAWHRPGGEGVGGHWGVEIVMSPTSMELKPLATLWMYYGPTCRMRTRSPSGPSKEW